jgi:hypothetical protein
LHAELDIALAAVYRRRNESERLRRSEADVDTGGKEPEPPESARAAPDILAVEVLADVLARDPQIIPRALHEAGQARFYPTFLTYLVDNIVEVAGRRHLNIWKRFAAGEHVDLMDVRCERVCEILRHTDSWAHLYSTIEPPAGDGSSRTGSEPGDAGVTASMLGTGEMRDRAAQVKEQCLRAASYVREKAGWGPAEWKRVSDLLGSGDDRARAFIVALKRELLVELDLVRRLTDAAAVAVPFHVVLDAELREIEQSRVLRRIEPFPSHGAIHSARVSADMDLLGVSLSGGGVRSATFNLGVLQALAQFGLLKRVDYLSTVSGGGYIGAWLTSCSKRVRGIRADGGVLAVEARLQTEPLAEPDALSVRAVRFLREYSNYLTPQSGVFTADTWTMIAIWLRNTLLNQAVLVLTLCGILGVPGHCG